MHISQNDRISNIVSSSPARLASGVCLAEMIGSLSPFLNPSSHFSIINKASDHRQASWNNSFHFPLKVRQTRVRSVCERNRMYCNKCNASKGGAVVSSDSKWSKVHTKSHAICLLVQLRIERETHINPDPINCVWQIIHPSLNLFSKKMFLPISKRSDYRLRKHKNTVVL